MSLKHIFKGTKWDVPCEKCQKLLSECACPPPPEAPPPEPARATAASQRVRVSIEKRGKGKKVTVLAGLAQRDQEELLPRLKAFVGAGGTIKEGKLEVQGEHKEKLVLELVRLGYDAR
jgi:translation initiation factor 1